MSALTFALVLLGCSDAGDECQALQTQQAVFATRAECTAQIEPALMSGIAARADYPSVLARCEVRTSKVVQTPPKHLIINTVRPAR
ncbi:hypothetical protein [Novosphingobium aquae]|uniref:Lipoprotein n=1 Tax=Novosphingobium aquae TaxID=3133435 RepID=A0ABU8S9B9_9SPHN